MSRSHGTGIPIMLKCRRCRGYPRWQPGKPEVTGNFRKIRNHSFGRRGRFEAEYKCQECGYVGKTSHIDAERQLVAQNYVRGET